MMRNNCAQITERLPSSGAQHMTTIGCTAAQRASCAWRRFSQLRNLHSQGPTIADGERIAKPPYTSQNAQSRQPGLILRQPTHQLMRNMVCRCLRRLWCQHRPLMAESISRALLACSAACAQGSQTWVSQMYQAVLKRLAWLQSG